MPLPHAPYRAAIAYRRAVTFGLGVYWLIMATATHLPTIPSEFDSGVGDKTQHRIAYLLLGLGLGIVWHAWTGLFRWTVAFGLFAVAALYGAIDEWTQPAFGRECDLLDWYADIQGAFLGILAAMVLHRLTHRKSSGQ